MPGIEAEVRRLSARYSLDVDPQAKVRHLPVGVQRRVEILKALFRRARVLILDEPTSGLSPPETAALLDAIRRLRTEGLMVLFITHKLNEPWDLSDSITVLRRGRVAGSMEARDADEETLASPMIGQRTPPVLNRASISSGREVLRVEDAHCLDDRGRLVLAGVSLTVFQHEVVGIAGVDGNGQRELSEVVLGIRPLTRGRITFEGQDVRNLSPRQRFERGAALIPENRRLQGLVMDASIAENLILKSHRRAPLSRKGLLSHAAIRRKAAELIDQ
jgi:simple sugar transport system ATP-binding protein